MIVDRVKAILLISVDVAGCVASTARRVLVIIYYYSYECRAAGHEIKGHLAN